jgi:hypothetical protein
MVAERRRRFDVIARKLIGLVFLTGRKDKRNSGERQSRAPKGCFESVHDAKFFYAW